MEATLTLHQAGNQLGVEDTTLSRLIRVGGLPEARKVNGPQGVVWVIPTEDLPAIARRNGWTIDLRDGAEAILTEDTAVGWADDGGPTGWDTTAWRALQDAAVDAMTTEAAAADDPQAALAAQALHGTAASDDVPATPAADAASDDATDDLSADAAGGEAPTAETPAIEAPTAETPAIEAPTAETPAIETRAIESSAEQELPEEDLPANVTSIMPAGTDRDSAIEVSIAPTTPVPARDDAGLVPATDGESAAVDTTDAVTSMVEALDLALLERLLEAQEGRVSAEVVSQENKHALAALNVTHNRATAELEVERRERMMAADRYREERMARAVADAKVAELRDRLVREMALADAEKEARTDALTRSVRAERDAANAVAAMGWRARRRYRKLNTAISERVTEGGGQHPEPGQAQ